MLYKNSVEDTMTHWAINGLEGCPAVEPPVFQLLRLCRSCELQTQQLLLEKRTIVEKVEERDTSEVFVENLLDLYIALYIHKMYILNTLPPFIQQVEGLSRGTSDRNMSNEIQNTSRLVLNICLLAFEQKTSLQFLASSLLIQSNIFILSTMSQGVYGFLSYSHANLPIGNQGLV